MFYPCIKFVGGGGAVPVSSCAHSFNFPSLQLQFLAFLSFSLSFNFPFFSHSASSFVTLFIYLYPFLHRTAPLFCYVWFYLSLALPFPISCGLLSLHLSCHRLPLTSSPHFFGPLLSPGLSFFAFYAFTHIH
jgi:hypothetical protein